MNKHKRDHMDAVNVVMFVLNSVTFHHGAVLYPIIILCGNKFRKYCRIWTSLRQPLCSIKLKWGFIL